MFGDSGKTRGPVLGVPVIRVIVYWGQFLGTLFFGNSHIAAVSIMDSRSRLKLDMGSLYGSCFMGPTLDSYRMKSRSAGLTIT